MNNKKKIILLYKIYRADEPRSPSKLIPLHKPLSSRFSLEISAFGSRAHTNIPGPDSYTLREAGKSQLNP